MEKKNTNTNPQPAEKPAAGNKTAQSTRKSTHNSKRRNENPGKEYEELVKENQYLKNRIKEKEAIIRAMDIDMEEKLKNKDVINHALAKENESLSKNLQLANEMYAKLKEKQENPWAKFVKLFKKSK